MLWLLTTFATAGIGALSVHLALRRLDADADRLLREAPLLAADRLVEGAYGRIKGRAISHQPPVIAPGVKRPCLLYELVVWYLASRRNGGDHWREIHRETTGGELVVMVGDIAVRLDARDVHLVTATAPSHGEPGDLRRTDARREGTGYTSWVRYVELDATIEVAGTVVREVDANPAATTDYREVATRLRLVGTRTRPLMLGTP